MAKRVHELAADLEIEVGGLLAELETLGVAVRNHMSRLKDDDIDRVFARYAELKNPQALQWAKERQGADEARQKEIQDKKRKAEEALIRAAMAHARVASERKTAAAAIERQKAEGAKKAEEAEAAEAPGPVEIPVAPAAAEAAEPEAAATPPAVAPEASIAPSAPVAPTPEAAPVAKAPEGKAPAARTTVAKAAPAKPAGPQRRITSRISPQRATAALYPPAMAPAPPRAAKGRAAERPAEETRRPARRTDRPKTEAAADKPLDLTAPLPTIEVMRLDKEPRRGRKRDRKKAGKAGGDEATDTLTTRKRVGPRPSKPVPGATGRRPAAAGFTGGAKPRSLVVKRPVPRLMPRAPIEAPAKKVTIHGEITVAQLAEKMRIDAAEIIKRALFLGTALTVNETISQELIELIAPELEFQVEVVPDTDEHDVERFRRGADAAGELVTRPPVVTIMGHVDHGKTSLLEQIAKLEVLTTEHGGITQHIGAYHVKTERGEIVFLDTPGHAAFTAMRQRGAKATDIVALVVAANDGVMPQTAEAINHSKAAGVPIIVVINKIDLPEANPARVKQQLMAYELVPEELGGTTLFVEISAKKGINIDGFLEALLLQAEILELRADPSGRAEGVVLEARLDTQRGIQATFLVQRGTLKVGDAVLAGQTFGRIRSMLDHLGRPVEQATPSFPARVYGLTGEAPEAGEAFLAMPDEREARHIAEIRANRRRNAGLAKQRHVSLEGLQDYLKDSAIKELNLILKGDVQGSIEAIEQSFEKLPSQNVKIRVLHSAVGVVTESDVRLAAASDAIVIGFNVRPDPLAVTLAQQEGVEIKTYNVIYDLLDEVQKAMLGLLEVKYREVEMGKADVLETFKVSKVGTVAGCFVSQGEVRHNAHVRLMRDGAVVYTGKIASLRRVKESVERVQDGLECGIGLERFNDIKKGDVIEAYSLVEMERVL